MNKLFSTILLLAFFITAFGQSNSSFADSIRVKYKIPELAYAVVLSDSILEIQTLGVKRINSNLKANINDKFRIGSNTKTITSYIAALLVKQGKIKWDTKFFDLYPELKAQSNVTYQNITLQDLLTFRTPIIGWTYTNTTPTTKEIKGNLQQQRYKFITWALHRNIICGMANS